MVGNGVAVQVMLVGSTDDDSGHKLINKLASSGVPFWTSGYVADPARYLRAMDALCLPTHREGLGNAILEAFACGVPVIATSVTGVVDIVSDGATGLLVRPKDPSQLAHAMTRVVTDKRLATDLSRNAMDFVQANFSMDSVTDRQVAYIMGSVPVAR